ncbi:MAG: hypothetical protein OES79_04480 [Planctomycetota bacterium]|nr:hypothetical protein [Planctomycetota bacterium]
MGFLIALVCTVGMLLAIIRIAKWILGPFDQAAKSLKRPTRFQIVDFFCLIFELQLVFAFFAMVDSWSNPARAVAGFVCLTVVAMWYKGVSVLSHAGIEHPWHRAAFNWFVLPVAYFGTLAGVPLILTVVMAVFVGRAETVPLWVFVSALVCPLGLVMSKLAANWIMRDIQQRPLANTLDPERSRTPSEQA